MSAQDSDKCNTNTPKRAPLYAPQAPLPQQHNISDKVMTSELCGDGDAEMMKLLS